MRICQEHWGMLVEGVKSRGMWDLVPINGEEAAKRMQRELEGKALGEDFDPLMAVNMMILMHSLDTLGSYILVETEICPVCEILKASETAPYKGEYTKEQLIDYWINGPLDAILEICRDKGLVTKQ